MLKWRGWPPESMKRHSNRCWMLSEAVRAILQVLTKRRMRKMRKMTMIPSRATWVKMTNPAGWWVQSPKWYISKKYFCPGGMTPSEWMCSVRAVRDTPVADYSARGLNTTRRIAYRPQIAVSPFLLALSGSNCKRTLWRWRPTVTIRSNGFIGHAFALELQCDGWRCENHSTRSFYLRAKCNSLFTNYTHHSKSPDLCGYWQSIGRSVRLLSYY